MKTRTHHRACEAGRPGEWTYEDAEAARREANETAGPWGSSGPTPEEAWCDRSLFVPEERAAFGLTVRELEREARQEQGYAPDAVLDRLAQAAVWRVGLQRALVAHGLLAITRGR